MPWIAPHKVASNLGVETLPKSSKVCRRLYRAMIWSKEMDDERCLVRTDPWSVLHPEEILQAGRNPRWPTFLVVNLRLTSILEANVEGGNLVEEFRVYLLFQ
jgi:hypothetical protein